MSSYSPTVSCSSYVTTCFNVMLGTCFSVIWCMDHFHAAVLSVLFQHSCRRLMSQTFDRNLRVPPHQPLFMPSSSICSQLSPFLRLFPSSPTRCLSAICLLFFLQKYVRAQSRRLQAFPHNQPNLSSWFSACLFWVFLRDDISAGKPNGPERVLSLWGSSRRGVKIGKSFLGNGIKNW